MRQLFILNAIFYVTVTSYILYHRNHHDEPVHILRTYVGHFLRGRPLDITDESQLLEGETREIFVSRLNLFQDGMDELLQGEVNDYSLPLDVTFTGELAEDMGGPRKEFLTTMMRLIKEKLFRSEGEQTLVLFEDETAAKKSYYLGAGVIFGEFIDKLAFCLFSDYACYLHICTINLE